MEKTPVVAVTYYDRIDMIASLVIGHAKDQIDDGVPYQDVNSAIHGVLMDVKQKIVDYMRLNK